MATVSISVLLILASILCAFNAANAQLNNGSEEDINVRLARIEATLEKVLEKNNHLEKRVVALEEENKVLKESIYNAVKQQSERTESTRTNNSRGIYQKHRKHGRIGIQQDSSSMSVPTRTNRQLNAATVAFTAVVSPPSINVIAGQTIVYDSVITNVGGAYNSQTGVFTAPVRGVYAFNFAEMIDPGQNEYLEIVKDGLHVIWNYGHAYGANHLVSSSRTATVEVDKGSQVWVQTQNSGAHGTGTVHGNSFTTFSGWLLAITE